MVCMEEVKRQNVRENECDVNLVQGLFTSRRIYDIYPQINMEILLADSGKEKKNI